MRPLKTRTIIRDDWHIVCYEKNDLRLYLYQIQYIVEMTATLLHPISPEYSKLTCLFVRNKDMIELAESWYAGSVDGSYSDRSSTISIKDFGKPRFGFQAGHESSSRIIVVTELATNETRTYTRPLVRAWKKLIRILSPLG